MQLLQMGLSSPHLMRRLRHVRQPVLVLFRNFADADWLDESAPMVSPASTVDGSEVEVSMLAQTLQTWPTVSTVALGGLRVYR